MNGIASAPGEALLSRVQVRAVDQALINAGIPGIVLMENAGRGAAELVATRVRSIGARHVAVLVGPGGNGGDGYVVARHLKVLVPNVSIGVVACSDPARVRGDAAVMRDAWRAVGGTIAVASADATTFGQLMTEADFLIDGLFGTGLDRPLTDTALALVCAANATRRRYTVALDVPSGLNADTGGALGSEDTVLRADETFTFAVSKPGLHTGYGLRLAGKVTVVGLGAPIPPELLAPRTWLHKHQAATRRAVDSHKGTAGHVLVIGGSRGKVGAALLAARGAHRAGAGRVTIASRAAMSMDRRVVETMTARLPNEARAACLVVAALLQTANATVIGPGLGTDTWAASIFETVISSSHAPLIIDADALHVVRALGAALGDRRGNWPVVLTPHPLEMSAVMGTNGDIAGIQSDRLSAARYVASYYGAIVVLKGAGSVIADPDGRAWIMPHANPTLAVAGSGDVLAGVIAAGLAENERQAPDHGRWIAAVRNAVDAHGRAGDRLERDRSAQRGVLASEIADAVSAALEER